MALVAAELAVEGVLHQRIEGGLVLGLVAGDLGRDEDGGAVRERVARRSIAAADLDHLARRIDAGGAERVGHGGAGLESDLGDGAGNVGDLDGDGHVCKPLQRYIKIDLCLKDFLTC